MAARAEKGRPPSRVRRRLVSALLTLAAVAALWAAYSHLRRQPPLRDLLDDAALRGDTARLASLLNEGADPNTGASYGQPVLAFAIDSKNPGTIQVLLDRGASVNVKAAGTTTFLMYAIAFHPEAVNLLLAHGADPGLNGEDGWTPLTCAINSRGDDFARALLDRGANVNAPTVVAVGNEDGDDAVDADRSAG